MITTDFCSPASLALITLFSELAELNASKAGGLHGMVGLDLMMFYEVLSAFAKATADVGEVA